MVLSDRKVQNNIATTQQNQPKAPLKATWVVEDDRLICKWLTE
ncbi:hypothetical protein N836_23045 [Leptolyngbya sp. Heron Island J]|nr:hypothetical protein N836_23045 [Leptolyngbya sp. Heron Island J]